MSRPPWDINADEVAELTRRLVRCGSPNPPGDVADVVRIVREFLEANRLAYRVDRPTSERLNLVCTVESGLPGPHIVLSGHLDTFPGAPHQHYRVPARESDEATVHGTGTADMKGGVAGALVGLAEFARTESWWRGRISVVLVCDEESFGPHGARRLLADRSLVDVDAVLTAEPSGRGRIRYGERGPVWGVFEFSGPDGHAGYSHGSALNPIERAATLISTIREDFHREFSDPVEAESDPPGATLTVSTVRGGRKVNMQPTECELEVDVRVPVGLDAAEVAAWMSRRATSFGGRYRPDVVEDANASDRAHPVFDAMALAVADELGAEPVFEVARGSTDGRLWRRHGVPVAQYGADPLVQATADEQVTVAELGEIARIHARTAWTLLTDTK